MWRESYERQMCGDCECVLLLLSRHVCVCVCVCVSGFTAVTSKLFFRRGFDDEIAHTLFPFLLSQKSLTARFILMIHITLDGRSEERTTNEKIFAR